MSTATGKWELGCCVFDGGFQEYDRYTSLGAAVSAYATSITLNSTVTTNYAASPMFLKGAINKNGGSTNPVYGPEIIIGPSGNSSYSGSVERLQPSGTVSGTTINSLGSTAFQHTSHLSSAYASGDPVIIRTVPLGWNPGGTFQSYYYLVCPIGRYEDRHSNYYLNLHPSENLPLMTDYKKLDLGVRLVCNHDSTYSTAGSGGLGTNNYIKKSSDLNSFNSRIRAYRASWYYRIVGADPGGGAPSGNPFAAIDLELQDANGTAITIGQGNTGEEGHNWNSEFVPTSGVLMYRTGYSNATVNTGAWVFDSKILSPFNVNSPDWYWISNTGSAIGAGGVNPSNQAMNRGNRWGVELHVSRGINTAFDVDDLIIEHAHGTSQEANGYYEIDDWPVTGSVSWEVRDGFSKNVMMNGSIRSVRTNTQTVPKYTISCDYENVDASVYQDLVALMNWQRRGYAICLRPFGYDSLPPVLIGFLSLTKPSSKSWSLDRVSFSMGFEES